jgi:GT2 family glycosyltransferase
VPSLKDDAERHDYTGTLDCRALYSGNMAGDREALLTEGGFDGLLKTGSDNDLCYRWLAAGHSLAFEPDLVVWHHDWRDEAAVARVYRSYWRGQGVFYAKHLRAGDRRVLRFLRGDVKWWLVGVAGRARARARRRPVKPVGEARGFAWGMLRGLVSGWRSSR